jgi:hypothetical protein
MVAAKPRLVGWPSALLAKTHATLPSFPTRFVQDHFPAFKTGFVLRRHLLSHSRSPAEHPAGGDALQRASAGALATDMNANEDTQFVNAREEFQRAIDGDGIRGIKTRDVNRFLGAFCMLKPGTPENRDRDLIRAITLNSVQTSRRMECLTMLVIILAALTLLTGVIQVRLLLKQPQSTNQGHDLTQNQNHQTTDHHLKPTSPKHISPP